MPILSAENHFRQGLAHLADGDALGASQEFHQAIQIERQRHVRRPQMRYVSYYGLSLAMAHGPTQESILACESAARRDFFNPDLLLNLGKVYALAGLTTRALAAFERGLKQAPNHPSLHVERAKIERRRTVAIGWLSRSHTANRVLGRLRTSLNERMSRSADSRQTVTPS
jgi:tetratricopeptide (TPR) repeat protein